MRRLNVPRASSKEELQRLLLLQIEREFPLSPQELAWGYQALGREVKTANGDDKSQEFLVVAVKKDLLQQYANVLQEAGLTPTFTVGALARSTLCRQPPISFTMLDIGRQQSEVVRFDHGVPETLRVLPWGGENITSAIEKQLGITHAEAEKTKIAPEGAGAQIHETIGREIGAFASSVGGAINGQKIYITGGGSRTRDLASRLAETFGTECERIEFGEGEGHSATVEALERSRARGVTPVILSLDASKNGESAARPVQWQMLGLAVLLVLTSLSLRYLEPLFFKSRVNKKISELRAYGAALPRVERELALMQYLKTNQPPYLDTIHALAQAAAPGTRIDALSLNSKGDIGIRATVKDSQQVTDWRSKLIDSGNFASVVVDEQTPSSDRQKMQVRITAQWRTPPEGAKPAKTPTATATKPPQAAQTNK
jgi:hypothetical protein